MSAQGRKGGLGLGALLSSTPLSLLFRANGTPGRSPADRLRRPLGTGNLIEQLPWAEPDDGVVFLRGGERAWYGIEIEPPTVAQMDAARSEGLSEGIRVMLNQGVPMGQGGRVIVERAPAPEQFVEHFLASQRTQVPDELLASIREAECQDLARARLRGEITITRTFFTAYVPVPKRPKNLALTEAEYRAQMALVRRARTALLHRLEGLGLRPAVMSSREVKYLQWRYLNGNLAGAQPPKFTSALDLRDLDPDELSKDRAESVMTARTQVAETEIGTQHPGYLTMSDRLIGIISLEKGGSGTYAGVIDGLLARLQNRHFYVMIDFEHLHQGRVKAKLDSAIDELEGMADSPVMRAGQATESKARLAREAVDASVSGDRHYWRLGVTTVLYARTREELTELTERTRSEYSLLAGAHAIVSNEQLRRTFFDVMPFSRALTRHRVSGHCINVADMFPKVSPWMGSPSPIVPLRNRHGSLTGLNLREGVANAGVMVLGPSGGGKSVWNMNLLLNYVPQGVRAFVLDPKHDYDEVTTSLRGQVIPISATARLPDGRPTRINVFDPTPGEDMPSPSKVAFIVAVLRVLDLVPDAVTKTVIEATCQQLFTLRSRTLRTPGEADRQVYVGARLADFAQVLSSLSRIGAEGIADKPQFLEARDRLSAMIQPYLAGGGGVLGDFLDGETTVKVTASCVTFDVSAMFEDETMRALGVLLVGEFMFQQAAKMPGTKIGIFEELGTLARFQEMADLVNRWFKMGRSMGMIPVGTSQEVEDFRRLGGLINNSSWVVITGLSGKEVAELQAVMGLSDHAGALAGSLALRPGVMGEYLVLQKIADGVYVGDVAQLWMSPEKLWTCTTHPEEKRRREEYTQRLGSRTEAVLQLAAENRKRRN